jgi:hypothetical protein
MPLAQQEVPARLRQRFCLVCGYDGPELQGDGGDETYRCPACDADLYTRPPRSYAELEGLDVGSPVVNSLVASGSGGEQRARGLPAILARLLGLIRPTRAKTGQRA